MCILEGERGDGEGTHLANINFNGAHMNIQPP